MKKNSLNLDGIQPISIDTLIEKYCYGNETTPDEIYQRVAKAIASCEKEDRREAVAKQFYEAMSDGAIGGGRINASAGTPKTATLMNCFVQPVGDSIIVDDENGYPGIYTALGYAAETMRKGGGVGYDFSRIRPMGALVASQGTTASGPCSYIDVFNTSCSTVESEGSRRGAQMGVLRCDHPDIEKFIVAKSVPGTWTNFNVSVAVTDKFMDAVKKDTDWPLVHIAKPAESFIPNPAKDENGKYIYKTIRAKDLWDKIMRATYDYAEPGVLFVDRMNQDNNLHYIETIEATNPCVTGDTLILTDNGYQRIDSRVGLETNIWNGYEWSTVVPRITGNDQQIYDMEFSDGTKLSCTPYHKFILEDGTRIEAKDLASNHKLSKFNLPVIDGEIHVNDKVAYTQGFYSGDGSRNSNDIWLYNEKCDLLHHLSISGYSDHSNDKCERICAITDFKTEPKDFVPNVEYDIHTRLNWFAGLIDSDGSVSDKAVTIWSVNRNFLHDVKLMLTTLGVNSSISLGHHASEKNMPDGKGGFALYKTQNCWRICVSGWNIKKLKELGLKTYRVNISSDPDRAASRFVTCTFKRLRNSLEKNVYCFTDSKNNSGVFNGLMTGNCAEQPLPPYGCCDLGQIILTRFIKKPFMKDWEFDFEKFEKTVRSMVRFLDNVLDCTQWPLEQQRTEAMNKRRVGLGYTGLGNALAMMNLRYDSPEGRAIAANITKQLRDYAYDESCELAKEKGAFPLLNRDEYLKAGTFASRLPAAIQQKIRETGIRNSHLLSIAPTGTISLAFADNCSNGIEPPFSWVYKRKKRTGAIDNKGEKKEYYVIDYSFKEFLKLQDPDFANDIVEQLCQGKKEIESVVYGTPVMVTLKDILPASMVTALELSVEAHADMLKAVQPFIDSSISKTVNVPADYPFEDFKDIYIKAFDMGLKGIATYRPNATLGAVLSEITVEKETPVEESYELKPNEVYEEFIGEHHKHRPVGELVGVAEPSSYYNREGEVVFYPSIFFLTQKIHFEGKEYTIKRPIEFFVNNACSIPHEYITLQMVSMSRVARFSMDELSRFIAKLKGIGSPEVSIRYGTMKKPDGNDYPVYHTSNVAVFASAILDRLVKHKVLKSDGTVPTFEEFIQMHEDNTLPISPSVNDTVKNKEVMSKTNTGKKCTACGDFAVIKKDGCTFCQSCGEIGSCG